MGGRIPKITALFGISKPAKKLFDNCVGKQISVVNSNGQVVAILRVNSKQVKYNFSTLRPGVYFLHASNGEQKIAEKFIKL